MSTNIKLFLVLPVPVGEVAVDAVDDEPVDEVAVPVVDEPVPVVSAAVVPSKQQINLVQRFFYRRPESR